MDLWRPHSVPLTSALCAELSCSIKIVFLQLDFYVLEVKATGRQFWRAGLVVSDNCVVHKCDLQGVIYTRSYFKGYET